MFIRKCLLFLVILNLLSCTASQGTREMSNYSIPVNSFSKTVELLVSNEDFLEEEILKINAQNPSVQRILLGADNLLLQEKFNQANSALERAYRITKQDGAVFLRLAHLRYRQGLLQESESFASKGLLLSNISSWERLLLNVYLKN